VRFPLSCPVFLFSSASFLSLNLVAFFRTILPPNPQKAAPFFAFFFRFFQLRPPFAPLVDEKPLRASSFERGSHPARFPPSFDAISRAVSPMQFSFTSDSSLFRRTPWNGFIWIFPPSVPFPTMHFLSKGLLFSRPYTVPTTGAVFPNAGVFFQGSERFGGFSFIAGLLRTAAAR